MRSLFLKHKTAAIIGIIIIIFASTFTIYLSTGKNKPGNISSDTKIKSPNVLNERNMSPKMSMNTDRIGLSTGGAKDIDVFRENLKIGYLPSSSTITYEGLYYDYYFDPGRTSGYSSGLFQPAYSFAVSDNPLTGEKEYFMSVGLSSNIKKSDFKRKKLNLMVVLDISGSMSSGLDKYYYDRFRNGKNGKEKNYEEEVYISKMELAKKTLINMLDHLRGGDSFGFAVFDDTSELLISKDKVSKLNMSEVKNIINNLQPRGGTNMEAGYKEALSQYGLLSVINNYDEEDEEDTQKANIDYSYENRIIFITDAMPNTGVTSRNGLFSMIENAADNKVYTSMIGVGVDFNTSLINEIMKIRGANYYSAHTNEEFKKRLDDEFEFMVTPLVFGLSMNIRSEGFEIEKIYGSPESDISTSEIMRVNTLFPSDNKDGDNRGGIIVLKLKKKSNAGDITINVSYEDRKGNKFSDDTKLNFSAGNYERFDNSGIQKGILLLRYADVIKQWLNDDNDVITAAGRTPGLNRWEHQSQQFRVSDKYKKIFKSFRKYFKSEMNKINDKKLEQEMEILEKLK